MKKIVIDNCIECPLIKNCNAWNKLSKKTKFALCFGVGVGKFILKECSLPDEV